MNPKESSEVTVETLLALRQEPDALRLITEKLRVKEMGPADHIRTKHEVKTFLETGDELLGAALMKRAQQRLDPHQTQTIGQTKTRKQDLFQ